ncbi:MAG: response regulator, partial [Cyanobacteria bacterium]|nr:response regulator [Cyanobacteriota bacterium]
MPAVNSDTTDDAISIFIAHDGHEIWNYVQSLLEDCGYAVSSFTDGHQALAAVREAKPHLVIVGEDICDISGLEWIIKVRQQDANVRLLFVSNTWRNADFYNCLRREYSVSLIVHRPFKPALFTLQVESLFSQPESTEANHLAEHENFERHQAMKVRYAKILPLRYQQLSNQIQLARRGQLQRHLSEALRLAHNMKSCTRSCGLKQLGNAAGNIEHGIGKILTGSEVETNWIKIETALATLESQIVAIEDKYTDSCDMQEMQAFEDASKAVVLFASG